MKKFFFFAASLLVAGSMMADVTIDLSTAAKPAHAASGDAVSFNVVSDVLTITATVGAGWGLNGAEFTLDESISGADIVSIKGAAMGTAGETWNSFLPYLLDADGARWFSAELEMNLSAMTDWTTFDYLPEGTPWDSSTKTFAQCSFVAYGVYTNPSAAITNYEFKVKDLVIVTKGGTALPVVKAADKVTKTMVNGQMVIIRNGAAYNALGAAL